jgi:hypothetical protein
MDLARPKLAESTGLSEEASEKICYDSIMKLTIHVLKDPRAGFKQVRYMERFLWIDENTGVRILWIVLTPFRLACLSFHL